MGYTNNNIVVLDFETGSRNPHKTQPIQIAAIMIDIKKLEMIPGSAFNAEMRPILDPEELAKLGLDAIEDEALKVNKKNLESLKDAKSVEVVWNEFKAYLANYKTSKSDKGSPIVCGFNNNNFDDFILERLGRKYGGFNKDKHAWEILHPKQNIDIFKECWMWFESFLDYLSLDSIREYVGMSKDNAHDALQDVYDTAELLVRFMRLRRHLTTKISFRDACKDRLIHA